MSNPPPRDTDKIVGFDELDTIADQVHTEATRPMHPWGDDITARLQAARDDLGGWATHPDHLLITVPVPRGLAADILQVDGFTPEQVNALDDRGSMTR